jgi:hypothetical protein
MTFLWLSQVRGAGALAAPAAAFARRELGDDPGAGAPTLLALARAIDAFAARDATPQEDARFVEGAGALFGLVLLAHVGEGEHVSRDGAHRVRLGRAGFVDPFRAVERCLEEGPAKKILVEATRLAEEEAHGKGPIARVAIAFEAALAAREDGRAVTERFDRTVFVGEVAVDLTRTIEATLGESDATLARSVLKLVEMLPGGRGGVVERREAEIRLLPRLVGPSFAVPGAIVLTPVATDLHAALVLAYEGKSRFVRAADLEGWSLSSADALAIATANLTSRARPPRVTKLETTEGSMLVVRTGDGLDSARLLLPDLRAAFGGGLGDPYLVAVPHRDVLLACGKGDLSLEAAFVRRVEDDAARAPHAISSRIYVSDHGVLSAR